MGCFFSQTTNFFAYGGGDRKTSAMMIILAMKFVAMLHMLNFSIKIHTCSLNNFFGWEIYVAEQV